MKDGKYAKARAWSERARRSASAVLKRMRPTIFSHRCAAPSLSSSLSARDAHRWAEVSRARFRRRRQPASGQRRARAGAHLALGRFASRRVGVKFPGDGKEPDGRRTANSGAVRMRPFLPSFDPLTHARCDAACASTAVTQSYARAAAAPSSFLLSWNEFLAVLSVLQSLSLDNASLCLPTMSKVGKEASHE